MTDLSTESLCETSSLSIWQEVVYRGAGQNLASYTGYGFQENGENGSLTTNSITPPAAGQLVAMPFPDIGCENNENLEPDGVTFSSLSEVPALSSETSLTPAPFPWLAADADIPAAGQSYGPYTFAATINGTSCPLSTGSWLGWEVAVPGQ